MGNILEIIKKRRSHRAFKADPIREEEMNLILEAGQNAPTGGNSQAVHFLVIRNKDVLEKLVTLVEQEFLKLAGRDDLYINVRNGVKRAQAGNYRFFYDAPSLIIVANERENLNGFADAACAMQNMMLEATELGIANCWINQLRWLDENPVIHQYLEEFGLKKEEVVRASLAVGYPEGKINEKPPKRTGMKVTFVD